MPLNWSVKNCKDWESLVSDEGYAATEVIVFALGMLGCGGRVTEKNAGEIYARLRTYEDAEGALRHGRGEDGKRVPVFFTPAEIHARIGLSTNWGSHNVESRAKWVQRVLTAQKMRGLGKYLVEYREAMQKEAAA